MTTINNGYINALLADATYALKEGSRLDGYTSAELKTLETLKTRMTPAQAKFISDNFEVVTHIDSGDYFDSGFDATVWQDINSGQTYVTMRGSDGLQDFIISPKPPPMEVVIS